jgi:hypothetical protein
MGGDEGVDFADHGCEGGLVEFIGAEGSDDLVEVDVFPVDVVLDF